MKVLHLKSLAREEEYDFLKKKSWERPAWFPFMNPSLFSKKSIIPVVPLYRGSDRDSFPGVVINKG